MKISSQMKSKILFWLGAELTHFCLAYALQKQFNADYYAVIDITKKPKGFFQKQELVKFNKIWYFFDHVKKQNKKPDYKYLSNFEKKYGINLWKLAVNERIFYRFYNFHKFTSEQICSILEQECKLYEKILDDIKPNFLITKDASRHHHQLFIKLCEARGVKNIVMSRTTLGYKVILAKESHIFDNINNFKFIKSKGRSFKQLQKYLQSFSFLKSATKTFEKSKNMQTISGAKHYLFSDNHENLEQYYYFGRTKSNVIKYQITSSINSKIRKNFLDKHSVYNPDYNVPFAYFPLHVDMERPLLIGAPFFTNQIEVIRHIVKSLPVGIRLYVKESPAGKTREWRKVSDYKEILNIPNVTLIHPSVPAKDLFKNCSVVFSIAGTSGFESAFYQKPSIVFSDVGYLALPSVTRVKTIENLPEIIDKSLETQVKSNDLDKFLQFMDRNTIDFDWFGFEVEQQNAFYHGGILIDVDIPISRMKEFLKKHNEILNNLAVHHIKKINSYKK